MINITDKSLCTGCTACYNICSHHAISMLHDEYGQIYPRVNNNLCTDCGLCEKVCPLIHQERIPKDVNLEALEVKAIYNKDENIRNRSTSGGVFSLLAEYVIEKGGIVCAARFDKNYHIYHSFFDLILEIDPYRGSKYAQSDLGDVFKQIKKHLRERPVLFVGTPCQVGGLKSYLMKDYDNLYTCDFICMSISSGKMWDEYITDYQKRHQIKRIFFKDKRIGWHKSDWRMLIEDEKGEHLCKGVLNPFFYSYLYHYSARPSCFSCVFRHCKHMSDITLADCWGIETLFPDFDDNKGCSTLIIQSNKGKKIYDLIKYKAYSRDYGIHNVRQYNRHIEYQASKPDDYEMFCYDYQCNGFMYSSRSILKKNVRIGIKEKLKKIIIYIRNEIQI